MKKILSIVEIAYRATIEEQDDTILWFNHAIKNSGADISILLARNAVNYAVPGHKAETVALGDSNEMHPPEIDQDLAKMIAKGIPVFVLEEDAYERGLAEIELLAGVQKISREALPQLFDQFDQVWHW